MTIAPMEKLAVSMSETARILGLHLDTVRKLVRSRELPSFKVGTRILVPTAQLRQYIEGRITEVGHDNRD